MKRPTHLLPLLFAAALLFSGCGRKHRSTVHSGKFITVTDATVAAGGSDTLRFGRLRSGETARQQVWLHNASSISLMILSHQASCGCTTPEYERQPITPGGEIPFAVTFDTRGLRGWQMKLIELRFAGAAAPLKIYLEAEVE